MKHLNGVYCADSLCCLIQTGKIGYDILLVGDGYVETAQIRVVSNQILYLFNVFNLKILIIGIDILILKELVETYF